MPGAGAIVAAIEVATGVVPISIGKPEPLLLEEACHVVGADPRDAVMIGDGIAPTSPLPGPSALAACSC